MPSQLHEAHLLLFQNQPALAAQLMREVLHVSIPSFTEARVVSADLTDIQPAEYRADMVIQLFDGASVFGIVVEVQLSVDERKRFVWPAYVANLRARLECPVCLLVVTADDAVARWAARRIDMGGLCQFVPYVLGPSGVPEVTEEAVACANPELAVLSAMAHGRDADTEQAVRIAMAAQAASAALDADRSRLYCDLILSSLSEAARRTLANMDPRKYEYQSDFARRYVAQGRIEGRAEGRAEGRIEGRTDLLIRLLTVRFGPLSVEAHSRITGASTDELDAIGERLLNAQTLEEALGPG
ncbi:MAG TPA: DUF4351 domain-containing protein [Steroidobacteraceae bacterium]|nr:DUF4351 domain-containing protein [Steroidobacteraceae bacterium]